MNPISVEVKRAEKRNRKIIIVIESDLYSDETFAVNPFYDEGDDKNQLQSVRFNISVTEKSGKIDAKVSFGNCLSHFTKGHSQIHKPLSSHFLSRRDCALDYIISEKEEYFTDEKIVKIINQWESDPDFQNKLLNAAEKRKAQFRMDRLNKAKASYAKALEELDACLTEFSK